ncbi:hypothetical protein, partial [Pseudomonas corrugata]|uniref:hypothetical protein n=1 Tax=Pseudomonas corrugata TaxID=47879 RepID=UPI000EFF5A1F
QALLPQIPSLQSQSGLGYGVMAGQPQILWQRHLWEQSLLATQTPPILKDCVGFIAGKPCSHKFLRYKDSLAWAMALWLANRKFCGNDTCGSKACSRRRRRQF